MSKSYDMRPENPSGATLMLLKHLAEEECLYSPTILTYIDQETFNKLLLSNIIKKDSNIEDLYCITAEGRKTVEDPKKLGTIILSINQEK